ncbi:tetratricopeptide repeat protein [Skermania sp. ID1734]|uniref:tetratricopeptide repeat protein n=1 Tax=Skermania sp. ID1734 TaxID=2597516 RepID=UPI00117C4A17|nr:tetratricopeptide repeat protein [Skermania sp. ID1734]TSD93358.1 tetratricopeptide repeat protein [Skermania sp. ID1734]
MAAAMSGAVDLSGLKQRAEAKASSPADGAGAGAAVVTVTEENFEAQVLERSMEVPVVVALASARSEASLALQDSLARLAEHDNGTWVLAKVEVDSNIRIAQIFGVQAIPTVIAIAGGQPLTDFQGVQPEEQLRQWIDAILRAVEGKLTGPRQAAPQQAPEDPRFAAAEEALDAGDFDRAAAAYQEILNAEPANAQAKAALRQVQFYARASAIDPDAISTADADPANVAAQLAAADAEVFAQQPEAAFDRLIQTVKRTAGDDRTQVRTRLLELFELFDTAEPVVVAARRKLATALY